MAEESANGGSPEGGATAQGANAGGVPPSVPPGGAPGSEAAAGDGAGGEGGDPPVGGDLRDALKATGGISSQLNTAGAEAAGLRFKVDQRPEGLPDKFFDEKTGEIRVDALLKSQADAERRLSALPQVPESYSFDVEPPDGFKDILIVNKDALGPVQELGKKHGWSDEAMNDAFGLMQSMEANNIKAEFEAAVEIFGDNDSVARAYANVEAFAAELAADKEMGLTKEMIMANADTAHGLKLLDALKRKIGGGDVPSVDDPGSGGEAITEASLLKRRSDPRYNTDRDFAAKVDADYTAFYTPKTR